MGNFRPARSGDFETGVDGNYLTLTPGPRPVLSAEASGTLYAGRSASPPCHRFWENSVASARLKVARNPRLNSPIVTRQPIYRHAHGTRTCVTRVRKSNLRASSNP